EIRVEANRGADVANVIRGVGVNGGAGDIFVPEIVAREWQEAVEAAALAHGHLGAVGGLLRAIDGKALGGRRTAARIRILHGHGERARRGRVARGRQLCSGDKGGGKRGAAEHHLSAGNEAGADDGQRETAEIGGGGGDAGGIDSTESRGATRGVVDVPGDCRV